MSFQNKRLNMKNQSFILILTAFMVLSACTQQAKKQADKPLVTTGIASTGPDAIIYQTKGDYNMMVPVILNDDKSSIVSFPAPGDLKYKGKPATPTVLADGFLLDNRGISLNVAFLDITYEEYMALESTPAPKDLFARILDKDPLTIMYNCGKRSLYKDVVRELNALILEKDFSTFEKIR